MIDLGCILSGCRVNKLVCQRAFFRLWELSSNPAVWSHQPIPSFFASSRFYFPPTEQVELLSHLAADPVGRSAPPLLSFDLGFLLRVFPLRQIADTRRPFGHPALTRRFPPELKKRGFHCFLYTPFGARLTVFIFFFTRSHLAPFFDLPFSKACVQFPLGNVLSFSPVRRLAHPYAHFVRGNWPG